MPARDPASRTAGRAEPGGRLGPYRLVGLLGAGGMGRVYRAAPEAGGPEVAVKTVDAREGAAVLASLQREITALQHLDHPGIVRIFDHGVEAGTPWYAMHLLAPGHSLRRELGATGALRRSAATTDPSAWDDEPDDGDADDGTVRDGLPRLLALTLGARIAGALAYLHGEGLVHRDVKPENILVVPQARPVLVDFGIATVKRRRGREALVVDTIDGGTLPYLAPERLQGAEADPRADLYALGCVLHELFTGAHPADARRLGVDPLEPPALDALVRALLEPDPTRRLAHADTVAARLVALGGEPWPSAPAPRPRLLRPRFTGRPDALAEAVAAVERGTTVMIVVRGPSGVGKTRFCLEVARRASFLTPFAAPCRGRDAGALHPFREIALAQRSPELGAAGAVLADLAGVPGAEPLPALSPAAARLRMWEALWTGLGRGDQRPLVLVDDVQRADELTLGFLGHLLQARRDPPIAVLASLRDEPDGADVSELLGLPGVVTIELGPLDPREIALVMADHLGQAEPVPGLAEAARPWIAGNPLYAAELLHTAVALGWLSRDAEGAWRTGALPSPAEVGGVGLPALRLGGASPEARRLAGVLALATRDTPLEVALEAAGGPDRARAVHELLAAHLLDEDDQHLAFAHDQIRDAAAAQVPAEALPETHAALARALRGRELPHAEGTHLASSGDLAGARRVFAAGASAAAARMRHAEACRLSDAWHATAGSSTDGALSAVCADQARSLRAIGRHPEALAAARRAVATATDEPSRLSALVVLVAAAEDSGAAAEASGALAAAIDGARALGDPALWLRVVLEAARSTDRSGRWDEADRWTTEGVRAATELGDPASIAEAHLLRATLCVHRRDPEGAEASLAAARPLLDASGRHAAIASAWNLTGSARRHRGDQLGAMEAFRRALAAFRAAGDRRGEALACGNLAISLHEEHRPEEAKETYGAALAVAREIGDHHLEAQFLSVMGEQARLEGRWSDALALLDEASARLHDLRNHWFQAWTGQRQAMALLDLGRPAEALVTCDQALARFLDLGSPDYIGDVRRFRLRVLRTLGRREEVAEEAGRLLDVLPDDFQSLLELARLRAEGGDGAGADVALERARELVPPERPEQMLLHVGEGWVAVALARDPGPAIAAARAVAPRGYPCSEWTTALRELLAAARS